MRFWQIFPWLLLLLATSVLAQPLYEDAHTVRRADVPLDAPRFEQFRVPVWVGKPAAARVEAHPRSRLYRTVIAEAAQAGPNFAGHYTVLAWGCGAGCSSWAIADAQSGRVFHPANFRNTDRYNLSVDLADADGGYVEFHADSRLLRVVGGINLKPEWRGISYFVWENNRLRRIRLVAKPYGVTMEP